MSASWFVSELTVSELVCQRDVCEALQTGHCRLSAKIIFPNLTGGVFNS